MSDTPFTPSPRLAAAQARARKLAEDMAERRAMGPAGSPGSLGEGNSNNSTGAQDLKGPMKTLGLDDKPPR